VANFNLNKVIIGGRLTDTPVLKTTPSGIAVTTFTVAVNRRFGGKNGEESQADFFNVTAWRQTAEFIVKFFRKASSICVVGSLQTRTWTDQNGQKRYATEIVADEVYFVDAKNEMPGQAVGAAAAPVGTTNAAQANTYIPQDYMAPQAPAEVLGDEEELPFD
jgi:single-strand DNA-binding protein